jgi:hypothetical protein
MADVGQVAGETVAGWQRTAAAIVAGSSATGGSVSMRASAWTAPEPVAPVTIPATGPQPSAEQPSRTVASTALQRAPADLTPETLSLAAISDRIGDDPPRNWMDLENTEHLEQLAAKLYDRLSDRLRRDVLVQRERSGFLMDSW